MQSKCSSVRSPPTCLADLLKPFSRRERGSGSTQNCQGQKSQKGGQEVGAPGCGPGGRGRGSGAATRRLSKLISLRLLSLTEKNMQFASRTVESRPSAVKKGLAQRNSKVAPPPKFPSDAWRATTPAHVPSSSARRRDERDIRDRHNAPPDTYHRQRRHSRSRSPVVFRGRSATPPRRSPSPPEVCRSFSIVMMLNVLDAQYQWRGRSPAPPAQPPSSCVQHRL